MEEMSRSETVLMLNQGPLFAGLTKRQLKAVAKVVTHMSFEPGKVLVKEMDVGQRMLVIREGTAEVTRRGVVPHEGGTGIETGMSRRLATLGPGDVVGELSLIDGKRASATVVAETPLGAMALYRTRFNELLNSTPELYRRLLIGMAGRVRAIDQRGDVTG